MILFLIKLHILLIRIILNKEEQSKGKSHPAYIGVNRMPRPTKSEAVRPIYQTKLVHLRGVHCPVKQLLVYCSQGTSHKAVITHPLDRLEIEILILEPQTKFNILTIITALDDRRVGRRSSMKI